MLTKKLPSMGGPIFAVEFANRLGNSDLGHLDLFEMHNRWIQKSQHRSKRQKQRNAMLLRNLHGLAKSRTDWVAGAECLLSEAITGARHGIDNRVPELFAQTLDCGAYCISAWLRLRRPDSDRKSVRCEDLSWMPGEELDQS